LALGLLLASHVRDAEHEGESSLAHVAQAWFEPESGMPFKADVCEVATLHALVSEDFSDDVCVALLDTWALLQNAPRRDDLFPSYFPVRPTAYFLLAELRWADDEDRADTHRLIMNALLRWRDNPHLLAGLVHRFERWLGFVHPDGPRALYGGDQTLIRVNYFCRSATTILAGGQG